MMKEKRTIILLSALMIVIFLGIAFLQKEEIMMSEKTIEYVNQGETIKVLNEEKDVVFHFSIQELKTWAKNNWDDIFEKKPSFGDIREVNPDYFYRFDDTALLSPRYNYLAFSVNDYAVATNISFIGIVNLESGEMKLVNEKNIGSVQKFSWAPTETHIAYILNSARAQGDYLSVDSISKMQKEFTLSENEISKALNRQDGLMPEFRNMGWIQKGQRLKFIANDHEGKSIQWSINFQGDDLKQEKD